MAGWIKLHRAIKDSDIYVMPPLYLRVFERLLIEANHQDNEIPFKYFGSDITTKKLIRRGERLTSIRTICEWIGWYEYGIFKKPNPKTVKEILDWLVANGMITIYENQSNRDGTHYNIVNYNDYQSKEDEEVTVSKQSVNSKETVTGSKQECIKNVKNVKKYILSQNENDIIDILRTVKDYPVNMEKDLEMIQRLKDRYPTLNLIESIKDWATYKLDRPLKNKDNPRSQINTSCKNYIKWGKNLKGEVNAEHREFDGGGLHKSDKFTEEDAKRAGVLSL